MIRVMIRRNFDAVHTVLLYERTHTGIGTICMWVYALKGHGPQYMRKRWKEEGKEGEYANRALLPPLALAMKGPSSV